jgi:hypothetical protein
MPPLHRFTCLLSNGFSISYNADLSVTRLTNGLLHEFTALAGVTRNLRCRHSRDRFLAEG